MVMEITGKKLNLVHENVAPGDAVFAGVCDCQKAKKMLGWEAKIDLRTGLKLTYEYMKQNDGDQSASGEDQEFWVRTMQLDGFHPARRQF